MKGKTQSNKLGHAYWCLCRKWILFTDRRYSLWHCWSKAETDTHTAVYPYIQSQCLRGSMYIYIED